MPQSNLVFGMGVLTAAGIAIWAGITDPEDGVFGGLRLALAGESIPKRTSEIGAAFTSQALAGLTATGAAIGSGAAVGGSTPIAATGARAKVLAESQTWLGTPYKWGGDTKAGVDCSGLTVAVFATVGINLPRVSFMQATYGRRVTKAQALPGDLVFFGVPVHHVGIYLGNGRIRHAPRTGTVVRDEKIWSGESVTYRNPYPSSNPNPKPKRKRGGKGKKDPVILP